MRIVSIAGFLLLGSFGCGASYPVPTDQFAAAQKGVGAAQEGGATNVPDAKLHLQLAQEDLATAKTLMDRDNQRAASLISRATAEAELALKLARQTQAQAQAAQAADALNKAKTGN
jgi:hypothetical protein